MTNRVSLCVIARNEEANLAACLEPVRGLVHEMVVVDTGSTDRTKDIATEYGARVIDFPWIDNFAAARNESVRHAAGDWIFWLDADDRLDEVNRERLRTLFAGLRDENTAYLMKCLCRTSPASNGGLVVYDHVRLFRNRPEARWRYRVHEQILPALETLSCSVARSDVQIVHVGYQDEAELARKCDRNLRLLHLDLQEFPNDSFVLYNLGQTYHKAGKIQEALTYFRQSLKKSRPGQSFAAKLYVMLTRIHRMLGQATEAQQVCSEGQARFPGDRELIFQEAWLRYMVGDVHGTESRLLQLIEGPAVGGAALEQGEDTGIAGHLARHNLAVLYRDQFRYAESETQWRAVLAEQPAFTPARQGLGELYLVQQRWQELDRVIAEFRANPATGVEAAVLESLKLIAFNDFPSARRLLEATIAAAPEAPGLRIVYARLLVQTGSPRAETERALRAVLAVDPNNREARQNLESLNRN